MKVTGKTRVAKLVNRYPVAVEVLDSFGVVLEHSSGELKLSELAEQEGLDLDHLLEELIDALDYNVVAAAEEEEDDGGEYLVSGYDDDEVEEEEEEEEEAEGLWAS
ncbi:MAG: hypothetical protein ACI8PZ_003632 [Myxococcota bacterium]|jgi:ribosomal protein L12E/L44/L45/RPP1/RPP2